MSHTQPMISPNTRKQNTYLYDDDRSQIIYIEIYREHSNVPIVSFLFHLKLIMYYIVRQSPRQVNNRNTIKSKFACGTSNLPAVNFSEHIEAVKLTVAI